MNWQGRIVTTPDTISGRPRIAGTRIAVEFILDLLAGGWSSTRILANASQGEFPGMSARASTRFADAQRSRRFAYC